MSACFPMIEEGDDFLGLNLRRDISHGRACWRGLYCTYMHAQQPPERGRHRVAACPGIALRVIAGRVECRRRDRSVLRID